MPHIGYFPPRGFPKPLTISPGAFVPELDTNDWSIDEYALKNRAVFTRQYFHAGVILPHGATVTRMTLYGYRDDVNSSMELTLWRSNRQGVVDRVGYAMGNFTGGYGNISDVDIDNPVIDNINYTYSLHFSMNPNDSVEDCYLTGVVIDWH